MSLANLFTGLGADGLYVFAAYIVCVTLGGLEFGLLALRKRSILEHLGRGARGRPELR